MHEEPPKHAHVAQPGKASTSPLPAQYAKHSLHPVSLITMSHPLTGLTVYIMCAVRLCESSDIHRGEGMIKVQAAFWRDLMRPFEDKVDS